MSAPNTSLFAEIADLPKRAWGWLEDLFWAEADGRAYAIVRVSFALAALFNWCELFVRRAQLFGPHGMIDGDVVRGAIANQPYYSIFTHTHSDGAVTAVFLVAFAAMIALGAGFHTRIAAFIVYAFHVSYSHYAFPVLHSWDALLRTYGFLVFISPCAAAWSLDAKRAAARGKAIARPGAYGLRLMQWQLAVVYVSTVWLKVPDVNWRNGRLLAFFQMSMYSRFPDVTLLAKYEVLSNLLTFSSLAIELGVVFMLWSTRLRFWGVFLGVSLHIGIALTSNLTVFSLCILAPYGAFFSGADIDRLESIARRLVAGVRRRPSATT